MARTPMQFYLEWAEPATPASQIEITEDFLRANYPAKTMRQIAEMFRCSIGVIQRRIEQYQIPISDKHRDPGRSKPKGRNPKLIVGEALYRCFR
jgi:transposase